MDSSKLAKIVGSDMTVSDKIRALAAAGYPRADIARVLGKRYQHVRNVLEADKLHPPRRHGVAEPERAFDGRRGPGAERAGRSPALIEQAHEPGVEDRGSGAFRLVLRKDGSVVIPKAIREAFGLGDGGVLMARLDGDEFKLVSAATAMARIDALMAPFRWTGGPLASDELIAERRAEAAREAND